MENTASDFASNINVQIIDVPNSRGLQLRTWVYRGSPEPRPVVLIRTPYLFRKEEFRSEKNLKTAEWYVSRGYHLVYQAIRGTAGSEGEFIFFGRHEIEDGYDAVQWTKKQEFCNGKIAIVGGSYDGFTALAAGIANPEGLCLVVADGAPSRLSTDAQNRNLSCLSLVLSYLHHVETGIGEPYSADFYPRIKEKLKEVGNLKDYDITLYGRRLREWQSFANAYPNPSHSYWSKRQIADDLSRINAPSFHIAGLNEDGDLDEAFRNFEEMQVRPNHHLILGHWNHVNGLPYFGGENVNPEMKNRIEKIFEAHLKSHEVPAFPKVLLPSHYSDGLKHYTDLPFPNWPEYSLYFGCIESGHVLLENPLEEHSTSEFHNLPLIFNFEAESDWPDRGEQHLKFLSAPLKRNLPIFGLFTLDLFLELDCAQTDIIAILYKLDKDGKRHWLTDAVPRSKVLSGPNPIIELSIVAGPTKTNVYEGERVGIILTSNLFPLVIRNRNNNEFESFSNAKIRLHHGAKHQSRVSFRLEPQNK